MGEAPWTRQIGCCIAFYTLLEGVPKVILKKCGFVGKTADFSCIRFFQRQAKLHLARHQACKEQGVCGLIQPSHGAQQHGTVGPEAHLPSQPEAVEEHLAQAQLVFLKGLRRFNPRANLLQEPLRHAASQGKQPKERFVSSGRKFEMARARG